MTHGKGVSIATGGTHFWKSPATRNRTRDHLIAAMIYSQMLYQLSYSRSCGIGRYFKLIHASSIAGCLLEPFTLANLFSIRAAIAKSCQGYLLRSDRPLHLLCCFGTILWGTPKTVF